MPPKSQQADKDATKGSATAQQPKKRPAASEIDDIFAKKSKPAPTASSTASGEAEVLSTAAKKKKGKKAKEEPTADVVKEEETIAQPKKAPETVVDTSSVIEAYKPAVAQANKKAKDMTEEEKKIAEEEQRFRDSRGTRKKTEDGLPIYDTSELKIGLGGDTELCPFDCECCF
ncbi:hypothetical protein JCM16303_002642 [Sporobolomyces ruberrimus]